MAAPPMSETMVRRIQKSFQRTGNVSHTAAELGISRNSVQKYLLSRDEAARPADAIPGGGLPAGVHEGTELPESVAPEWSKFEIDRPGVWLSLMDLHIPYHDRATIELAVKEAKARAAVGVLLNGDVLDSHEISRHDKDPRAPRYVREVEIGRQFFAWLRGQFPKADIVYKAGNHEDRLESYLIRHAPALFGMPGVDLPSFLDLPKVGGEWVADKRIVTLGKLHVVHGHEYPGGAASPVNPARGLYLKAKYVAMCGHHHRTSEHNDKDIRQKVETAWSVGCACHLHPRFMPINQWNHGYAPIELASDGNFTLHNRRVVNGKAA